MTQSIPSVSIPQAFARLCVTLSKGRPSLPGRGEHSTKSYTHVHGDASPGGPTPYPFIQWRIQGEGQGGPHLPYQTLRLFETEILTSKGLYITF